MLNPVVYTEQVIADFLRYQLTTYPFADPGLYAQMRRLLNLEETRQSPLWKGPYVSLSRPFKAGARVAELASEGLLHPHLAQLCPHPRVYQHQEEAVRHIVAGHTTLVSTGTGSGKTECFLYPIISRCLRLRDEQAPEGIVAVVFYPMNALAEDQLERLRGLLVGSGVSFGMYVGKTPEHTREAVGVRLPAGASRADYVAEVARLRATNQPIPVYPVEERVSREELREHPPRLLLTNAKQMELLLTRHQDVELFAGVRLEFLVFDEAHTLRGAQGAENACLVRRLRTFCGRQAGQTVCVATSATLADPARGADAAKEFASRFFGVPAADVALVGERYEAQAWAAARRLPRPFAPARDLFQNLLDALEREDGNAVKGCYRIMTGEVLDAGRWREELHERLAANELVFQMAELLGTPRDLVTLGKELATRVGRPVPEEEILAWLALGAAATKDGRQLVRPVLHGFVRGVEGAVVTFPTGQGGPQLWLSRESAANAPEAKGLTALSVLSCNVCGQHYFEQWVRDFEYLGKEPGGGEALDGGRYWDPLTEAHQGTRAVLLDRLAADADDENGDAGAGDDDVPRHCAPVWLCRFCGALHVPARARCANCGAMGEMVRLLAVQQREHEPGKLTTCVSCQTHGRELHGRYREPARPVRATEVADNHVLAQNLIHYAEPAHRRLLVFADNRQDAAFQAGWMRDHARRYRLRGLMFQQLAAGALSIGDLTARLDALLDADDDLSRELATEVWSYEPKERAGRRHQDERRLYLRLQVLREVMTGLRQRIGLEPWGRLRVEYLGLAPTLPFCQEWAGRLGHSPEALCEGVAGLLDVLRRNMIVRDESAKRLFSRFWSKDEQCVERGYIPKQSGVPKGVKLRRAAGDDPGRTYQWLSARGDTAARQAARKWGVAPEDMDSFFEQLWRLLTVDLKLLVPVQLMGARSPLPNCPDTFQVEAGAMLLRRHQGRFRCGTCRRVFVRQMPGAACLAWRCAGTTAPETERDDDYDLRVLDEAFAMLRPREHSAQVPGEEREKIERQFKGNSEAVNTLVCTPTLELGVDIGELDVVLMRNVPPLPANYWQRAGRAGRRLRMAVNLTYCRKASHDSAYFQDPLKLLAGMVLPPRFNLCNQVMIEKHVHAAVLTVLHSLAGKDSPLPAGDRTEIANCLRACFPPQIGEYLFAPSGEVRASPLSVAALGQMVAKHRAALLTHLGTVFTQGWPARDQGAVAPAELARYADETAARLQEVIGRLSRRLQWALGQLQRLDVLRQRNGTLDREDESVRGRCEALVKKLKGVRTRRRREAEGYDDTNTFGVLAAEGFLPGYGLEIGSVQATAVAPPHSVGLNDFDLPRPPAMAVREYVPGNLIYANGHRFFPRVYHFDPERMNQQVQLQVDVEREVVSDSSDKGTAAQGLAGALLRAVPMTDVDLPHQSQISDEEDFRFQMSVCIFGREQGRHGPGWAYAWGPKSVQFRQGVQLRLVNVGPARQVRSGNGIGYSVCLVCGQSRSPFASRADLDKFTERHRDQCQHEIKPVGFYCDIFADALTLQNCQDRQEAYSVIEALRQGAAEVMEMEIDDLQVLCLPHAGQDEVDAVLYDPMPGGSGLLDQMVGRWGEVVAAATRLVEQCPSLCAHACVDCLLTFRNSFYHRHLERATAAGRFKDWGAKLVVQHDITPRMPATDTSASGDSANHAEARLRLMLQSAGFPEFQAHFPIELGGGFGRTLPDAFYADSSGRTEGVCLYLDGMSGRLHGNPATAERDRTIRAELRARSYEVIEIAFGDLDDREAMRRHCYRLARLLQGRERADSLRANPGWPAAE